MFTPLSQCFALAVAVLAWVWPIGPLRFPGCWFKTLTEMPCPGCGLTRSISAFVDGRFFDALMYHPFGPLLYVLFAGIGLTTLLGRRRTERVEAWLTRRLRLRSAYGLLVALFLTHGFCRALATWLYPALYAHL